MNKRLPRALAGLSAVALMVVAATTTVSAQTTTTLAPRLALRAVTNGDISSYKLPATTQVSGGLGTVGLGEPLYMEVQVDIGIAASQLGGVTWAITEAPSGSTAKLTASPLGATVPIAEPSDRLIYQVAGRQLLKPDLHGLYVVSATVTIGGTATALAQSYIAGTYVGVAVCTQCHGGGLAEFPVSLESTFGLIKQTPSLVPAAIRALPFTGDMPDPAQTPPEVVSLAEAIRRLTK